MQRNSPRYFRNFFGRRMVRIFPLYYGTIAALLGWPRTSAGSLTPNGSRDNSLGCSPTPPTCLIADRGNWEFSCGWLSLNHFWSLAVEEQFYLLWPLIVLRASSRMLRRLCPRGPAAGVCRAGFSLLRHVESAGGERFHALAGGCLGAGGLAGDHCPRGRGLGGGGKPGTS